MSSASSASPTRRRMKLRSRPPWPSTASVMRRSSSAAIQAMLGTSRAGLIYWSRRPSGVDIVSRSPQGPLSDRLSRLEGPEMNRKASAQWQGDLKTGKGTVSTESGVLQNTAYSFSTRFENGKGTNPEELAAAAHAGCFTMALSAELGKANLVATSLRTTCTVTLDKVDGGWGITESHLEVVAKIPGASQEAFRKAAETAETGCPI